jgi:hypothetical protein
MISSLYEFIVALKKQFNTLGYVQRAIIHWQNTRKNRGQNAQDYTQDFRKRALTSGIPLYTQETLLKYIGGLHSYLRHTIPMLNPTNLDEVCV